MIGLEGVSMWVTDDMKTRLRMEFADADKNAVTKFLIQSFPSIEWDMEWLGDTYAPIDLQLTANTPTKVETYDIEVKAVSAKKQFDVCFFEANKWLGLIQYENNIKLYVVVYPYLNKIAVWRVDSALLRRSEKAIQALPKESTNAEETEKQLYRFKLSDAKLFDAKLTEKEIENYHALFTQSTFIKALAAHSKTRNACEVLSPCSVAETP